MLYFRVVDPNRAVVEVADYLFATSQLAQTTLRSVCGQAELDELLAEREQINRLQEILDAQTEPWGMKVVTVEVKHIDSAAGNAARHGAPGRGRARAPRQGDQRRGEFQAAQKLADASASSASIRPHCSCVSCRRC